ncbi:sugar phosphate isomerase/epimerase family protein [Neglectibacter caecimuris]|uniref:sugar phosphate isomerase/epimerase family protein n=1 Tax=Neglectibacter caecimuris TaxID=3093658 RepID=UPI002AC8DB80|nr:TIM barrel protein [Neglectibacter sp. M00184]
MQFGMPTLVENQTLEENIALCKELGLRFLELNMNFPEYQLAELEKTERLAEAAAAAGIYYTIHLDENLDVADFNRLVSGAYLETVRRTIKAAGKLLCLRNSRGDPAHPLILNMHLNHGIYITLPDRKVQMYERHFSTYQKAYRSFRKQCEEWIGDDDLMLTIENTDGFWDYEREMLEELLQSPKFGLTWDIGHSKSAGEGDASFLRAHRAKLVHFHIHDGSEQPPRNHLPLGDGKLDLRERLSFASLCGARCVLETKTAEALKKSVQWLKREGY